MPVGIHYPLPPPTRPVHPSAGSRSPASARNFTNRHRLAHLGRCLRSWLRRSRRWCRPPLFALRSATAAQDTAALQTDPPAASRGGPPLCIFIALIAPSCFAFVVRKHVRLTASAEATARQEAGHYARTVKQEVRRLGPAMPVGTHYPLPPPTRPVHPSAGSRSPASARHFTNRYRLAHLGRYIRSWWRRSRRWCRPPLIALRSTTAAQDTSALQTDPPAASRGGPAQSVNVVFPRNSPELMISCYAAADCVKPLLFSESFETSRSERPSPSQGRSRTST